MAAPVPTPPLKKPASTAFPQRKGKIKAQIFEGIADSVVSAASRACDFIGLTKKDDGSTPAPPPPPPKTTNTVGEDGRAV